VELVGLARGEELDEGVLVGEGFVPIDRGDFEDCFAELESHFKHVEVFQIF
jgi:hypothetical protein